MRRGCLVISLLCLPLFALSAKAHPRGHGAPYSVIVEDESGRELRTFHHGGQTFVLGTYGTRYNVRIQNRTGRRVEAVLSVDGRDAVSGKIGDYVSERGYLIEPHGEVVVEGFRQSLDQVAAFRFSSPSQSYSARMGTPENVGIIGVAFFPERRYATAVPHRRPRSRARGDFGGRRRGSSPSEGKSQSRRESAAAEAPAAPEPRAGALERSGRRPRPDYDDAYGSGAGVNNLGTEYGESRYSRVTEVPFRRESQHSPAQLITLRYDDANGLQARGIPLYRRPRPVVRNYPEAFPNNRFAPPPPY